MTTLRHDYETLCRFTTTTIFFFGGGGAELSFYSQWVADFTTVLALTCVDLYSTKCLMHERNFAGSMTSPLVVLQSVCNDNYFSATCSVGIF
jgi:hypothetical protein